MRKLLLFLAAGAFLSAGRADEAPVAEGFSENRKVSSSHFNVYHEAAYAPSGVVSLLEGHRATLLLDLQDFATWAGDEKIRVYVYANAASYVGKTGIPAWSAAYANVQAREIHCYESPDLPRILAHEMGHLFFSPYFMEKGAEAPAWLNEGVAKVMEWHYGQGGDTGHMNREVFARGRAAPLPEMTSFDYHHDPTSSGELSLWYEQAASVTAYMMRRLPRPAFTLFCDNLRNGKSVDEALKAAYGFQVPDLAVLERLWRESLAEK